MARVTDDSYAGAENSQQQNVISLNGQEQIALPDVEFVKNSEILRDGQNLILETADGQSLVIEGYFNADPAPMLSAPDGSAVKSIAFNAIKTNLETYLLSKDRKKFNILGKLSLNEWKGQKKVEFIIDDISVNKTINNTVPSSNG